MKGPIMAVVGLAVLLGAPVALAADCVSALKAAAGERHLTPVSKGETHVEFRDGPQVEVNVGCELGKPNVLVMWQGQNPDQAYYELVGRLGQAVSGGKPAQLIQAAKSCRQQALKDSAETSQVEQPGFAIECQAFARDDGGTAISIYPE
ncbi:hypothetical protein NS201_05185 [Pseudomonas oryzihabitans]|nr:hypothetical protein NS201_05185 [Pseudomonas psychrotolerans]